MYLYGQIYHILNQQTCSKIKRETIERKLYIYGTFPIHFLNKVKFICSCISPHCNVLTNCKCGSPKCGESFYYNDVSNVLGN